MAADLSATFPPLSPTPCSCIHVLDQDGQEQRRFGPLQQPVQHLAWAGDVLVAATSHTIHLWRQGGTEDEAEDGLVLHIPETGAAVLQIATCPQGRWLAAACSDNEVRWVCPPDAHKRLLAYMQRGPQPVCAGHCAAQPIPAAGAACCAAAAECHPRRHASLLISVPPLLAAGVLLGRGCPARCRGRSAAAVAWFRRPGCMPGLGPIRSVPGNL